MIDLERFKMNSQYEERYNERRPTLSFRVSPEVKDELLEISDNSDKTLGEVCENYLTDRLNSKDGKRSNGTYRDGYTNGFNAGSDTSSEKVRQNGFKNGSDHIKQEIKNRIKTNSQKNKDDLNKQIKKYLKDNESECPECGETFLYDGFDFCPYCCVEFDKNAEFNADSDLDFSNIRIPIISDIWDSLVGEDKKVEESSREDSRREESGGEDAKLNFVGGTKFTDKPKKDDDDGEECVCADCGTVLTENQSICPGCGSELNWE